MTGPAARDPWADPATPTQEGPPYAGPPPTAPQYPAPYGYPPPGYAPPGYAGPYGAWAPGAAWAPGGAPGWTARPTRPGQVVAAAVLAFVQATMVLIASLYLWFFASLADLASTGVSGAYSSPTVRALATEGTTLAVVQLLSAVALVVAGVLALNRRSRAVHRGVLAAHVLQLLLAGYWAVRLVMLVDDVPGGDPQAALVTSTLFFAAGPVVAVGLLVAGTARRWFDGTPRV